MYGLKWGNSNGEVKRSLVDTLSSQHEFNQQFCIVHTIAMEVLFQLSNPCLVTFIWLGWCALFKWRFVLHFLEESLPECALMKIWLWSEMIVFWMLWRSLIGNEGSSMAVKWACLVKRSTANIRVELPWAKIQQMIEFIVKSSPFYWWH